MNEEQLADILADHLDALLAGEILPESVPAEIADLLPVAQNLTGAAPVPRPEFGPALKQSLLGPNAGGNGTVASVGSTFYTQLFLIVVGGLLVLAAALVLLGGTFVFGNVGSAIFQGASPTAPPVFSQTAPAQPTPSPLLSTPTAEPASTHLAPSDSGTSPAPTATLILDKLPPITITVETVEDFSPMPDLVPGQSTSGDGEGGAGSGGDHDHDRGHGNDHGHHDHDNPGHGGDD